MRRALIAEVTVGQWRCYSDRRVAACPVLNATLSSEPLMIHIKHLLQTQFALGCITKKNTATWLVQMEQVHPDESVSGAHDFWQGIETDVVSVCQGHHCQLHM